MGVTGLWRLIEPSGKPVPLETLENKILAVDVSIWLHQAIKGFQDGQGGPLPNAHLLGLYHRVCKLLYFRIKPVFVFDGGVPVLKRETIVKRQQLRSKKITESERIQKELIQTLLKHAAVNKVLTERAKAALKKESPTKSPTKEKDNMYILPPSSELDSTQSGEEESSDSPDLSPSKHWDLHTIDEKSPHFKSLPADVRHDILTDLKETRKQSSWGRIYEMPKKSDDFSGFQMKRLLKRYSVQVSLEEAEKEMGGKSLSLAELEKLMNEQGIDTSSESSLGKRIASDENTRYLLIKDLKKALDEARKNKASELTMVPEEPEIIEEDSLRTPPRDTSEKDEVRQEKEVEGGDSEYTKDLEKAIQLSLQDVPSTSKEVFKKPSLKDFSFLEGFNDGDFGSSSDSDEEFVFSQSKLSSAKSYMTEYSGLTPSEIEKIINSNRTNQTEKNINLQKLNVVATIKKNNVSVDSIRSASVEEQISDDTKKLNPAEKLTLKDSKPKPSKIFASKEIFQSEMLVTVSDDDKLDGSDGTQPNICVNDNLKEISSSDIDSSPKKATPEAVNESDSSSGDDFLEVSETTEKKVKFEITVNHEYVPEDDIFSDIFSEKKEEKPNNSSDVHVRNESESEVQLSTAAEQETNILDNKTTESKEPEPDLIKTPTEQNQQETNILDNETTESKEPEPDHIKTPTEQNQNEELKDADKERPSPITTKALEQMQRDLLDEKLDLLAEKANKERGATNLTEQIHQEAQALLQLFGVPFVVAPMEAEAQCAFLELIDLTSGTITDDSDIWLFGGKTVYKNFFNMQKHVLEYRAEDIEHHFKLSREQMILLALLVGSDYTVGLQGVGPVTALEILAAFPPNPAVVLSHFLMSGLIEFRKWIVGERPVGPGKTGLRNKLKNVTLNESFPSLQVIKAYLEPAVDSSNEPFSWAKPDIPGLIAFAKRKFGWTKIKSEEILKPVLQRMIEATSQKSIKDYFRTKHKVISTEPQTKMSKRVKTAIKKIANEEEVEEEGAKKTKSRKKPAKKNNSKVKKVAETDSQDMENLAETDLLSDEDVEILKEVQKKSKRKVEEINTSLKKELEQLKKPKVVVPTINLHKKEVIPQKEQDKINSLRSKLKAIEVFRKSTKGPGYVKKQRRTSRQHKEDAGLSESSSD